MPVQHDNHECHDEVAPVGKKLAGNRDEDARVLIIAIARFDVADVNVDA